MCVCVYIRHNFILNRVKLHVDNNQPLIQSQKNTKENVVYLGDDKPVIINASTIKKHAKIKQRTHPKESTERIEKNDKNENDKKGEQPALKRGQKGKLKKMKEKYKDQDDEDRRLSMLVLQVLFFFYFILYICFYIIYCVSLKLFI